MPLRATIVGNVDATGARAAVDFIEAHRAFECRQGRDLADLHGSLDEGWYPDLVLVCQSWPDEFLNSEVAAMLGALPLARWVCAYSPWCDADGRSRDVWPLSIRVPARLADARVRREIEVLRGKRNLIPLTGGRDDVFAAESDDFARTALLMGPVLISSSDRPWREMLADVLKSAGIEATTATRVDSPERDCVAVIADVDPWSDDMAASLMSLRAARPQLEIIAMTSVIATDAYAVIETAGATRVLPKRIAPTELCRILAATSGTPRLAGSGS